ncbi:DUF1799 domain-containing protein [uncultured Sulfitobacter sp.]|uniref:DUF1799 domain-containing protein n=1 Tax=uncultured Sulfitobacter sp. TaxID=191468 RepID=UPI0030DDBECA
MKAAGAAWVRGSSGSPSREDDAQADAEYLGLDIEALLGAKEETPEIWPWQMTAVEGFLAICTQWRTLAIKDRVVPLGLDYGAAQAGIQLAGLSIDPATWSDITTIEQGAMAEFRRTM